MPMNKTFAASFFISLLFFAYTGFAQDTLPNFTIENKGSGRIVISWQNPYNNLIQLAVQRSYDSLKKFSTVYSATSPELPQNGYSDNITPGVRVFYKIFYVMRGGSYYFTKSKRPAADSGVVMIIKRDNRRDQLDEDLLKKVSAKDLQARPELYEPERLYTILVNDSMYKEMFTVQVKRFRDSILSKTKDTLQQLDENTISVRQYVPPFDVRASQYVFTDRYGYLVVSLPEAATKKYDIIIMEDDEVPVLELRNIKEPYFTIDKSNFYHGGLYKFVLWENGRIKERNKIILPRE